MRFYSFFTVILLTAVVAASGLPNISTKAGNFTLGKKPYPPGTRKKWIASGRVLSAVPEKTFSKQKSSSGYADNSAGLPPVGNQGSEGSCVHWAGTYAVKTHCMKRKNPTLDITQPSGQASPRFTYNLSNAGQDYGGWGHEPFELFMRYGCPDLLQLPYVAGHYSFLPDIDDFVEGLFRRTTNYVWAWDWDPSSNEVEQLKLHLDNGGVASVAVYANSSMSGWSAGDAPWVGSSCDYYNLNHMVCVCGYGPGWYKIMNSWGAGWGSNGFMIVDANYFENYFGDCMFPIESSYSPVTNYATIIVNHDRRSDIRSMIFDVNETVSWNFAPTPKDFPKGTGVHYTDYRSDLNLAVDLTFSPWNNFTNDIALDVKDSVSSIAGTINSFSVIYKGKTNSSHDTPVSVPDNNGQYASDSIKFFLVPEPGIIMIMSLMVISAFRRDN